MCIHFIFHKNFFAKLEKRTKILVPKFYLPEFFNNHFKCSSFYSQTLYIQIERNNFIKIRLDQYVAFFVQRMNFSFKRSQQKKKKQVNLQAWLNSHKCFFTSSIFRFFKRSFQGNEKDQEKKLRNGNPWVCFITLCFSIFDSTEWSSL